MNSAKLWNRRPMRRVPGRFDRQRGFFDFGLALIVLAVSGLSVYTIDADQEITAESEQAPAAPYKVETAAMARAGSE